MPFQFAQDLLKPLLLALRSASELLCDTCEIAGLCRMGPNDSKLGSPFKGIINPAGRAADVAPDCGIYRGCHVSQFSFGHFPSDHK